MKITASVVGFVLDIIRICYELTLCISAHMQDENYQHVKNQSHLSQVIHLKYKPGMSQTVSKYKFIQSNPYSYHPNHSTEHSFLSLSHCALQSCSFLYLWFPFPLPTQHALILLCVLLHMYWASHVFGQENFVLWVCIFAYLCSCYTFLEHKYPLLLVQCE